MDVEPLLDRLRGKNRKYSRENLGFALDAILNRNMTVTQASREYNIKRTSIQFYLKKLGLRKNARNWEIRCFVYLYILLIRIYY